MGEYQNFLFVKEGRIAILTFNRPENFNTFNEPVFRELEQAAIEIEGYDDVGAVIVNANGPIFSAGIDTNSLKEADSKYVMKNIPWLQSIYKKWADLSIPVIACIDGMCFGTAVEFLLTCDIRVASDKATFCLPETRLGLSPDMGGTARLTQLIGPGQAKRLVMTGMQVAAEEAKTIGLVEVLETSDKLAETTMKLAKRIAGNAPIAVKMAKKAVNVTVEGGVNAGLLFEQAQSILCCGSEDIQEGISAFFEKRKAVFKGV